MTKGMIISSVERLSDTVSRCFEPWEEENISMIEPDPPYMSSKDVQSATDDRSLKDWLQDVSIADMFADQIDRILEMSD